MDLVSDNGQGIVVFMHIRHLVYGCDDFNGSWLGNCGMNMWFQLRIAIEIVSL